MAEEKKQYDIFISYARENLRWVRENVYEPLLQYLKESGEPPRIFFDVSEEGIEQGQNFVAALSEAIQSSNKFIIVYSHIFFQKGMTRWELTKVFQLDPEGKLGKLNPLLIDPEAEGEIPFEVNHIQHLVTSTPGWFDRLSKNLGLVRKKAAKPSRLKFLAPPPSIAVNHTLPPLQVAVMGDDGIVNCESEISVESEKGGLSGTATIKAEKGVATFSDLCFSEKTEETRLVAKSEGHPEVYSSNFSVFAPEATPIGIEPVTETPDAEKSVCIQRKGDAVFFENGMAMIVLEPERISVFGMDGICRGEVRFSGRRRIIRRSGCLSALATWNGQACVLRDTGEIFPFRLFDDEESGFHIPADIAISDEAVYIGFWSGHLFRLTPAEAPVPVMVQETGIQALEVCRNRLFLCDLEGGLRVYEDRQLILKEALEARIFYLKSYGDCVIAVGRRKLYHFSFKKNQVLSETLPLSGVHTVLGDVHLPVIVDQNGKGLRVDSGLTIKTRFSTTPGARPVSADDSGRYCAFVHPDGSRSLMVDERVVYSHSEGTIAVHPRKELLALGDEEGIRVVEASALSEVAETWGYEQKSPN